MAKQILSPFEGVVGKELDFFGVDNYCFKVGDHVFEAIENEDDGYRSYLDSVVVHDPERLNLIFHGRPFAVVVVEEYDDGDFRGYALRDIEDNHVWLCFGTEYYDDYYPVFRFKYEAKKPK